MKVYSGIDRIPTGRANDIITEGCMVLEGDMEKLGDLYWLGYNDANQNIDKIKEYLGSK